MKSIKNQFTTINTPIQGTAADIIKLAMIEVEKEMDHAGLNGKMILQIHDELVFDVPKGEKEQLVDLVKYEMENVITLEVPLIAEVGVGPNWLEAH